MDNKKLEIIYNSIKNNTSLEENARRLGISEIELRGLIELLTLNNKQIKIIKVEDKDIICKQKIKVSTKSIKIPIEECIHTKLLIVSDTHFGNKKQQLHLLNKLYEEAYQKEISIVLHVGDLVDGDYSSVRKESPRQVFLHGFDEQCGYVVDMYPMINGIKTKFILGSHDETHYKNGQATLGMWIPKSRSDMEYLGQDQATININKIKITLDHPGDGSSYALSYKPQKRIEELETGNKPKLLLMGHYHKAYYFVYRNVHCLQVPCLCDKTQFQTKKSLSNVLGGYFLDIYSDNRGNIEYLKADPRLFDYKDIWDESGKDSHKVRQLRK